MLMQTRNVDEFGEEIVPLETAIEQKKAYTKPRLKRHYNLRPKRGQAPAFAFKNAFGTECFCFSVADCIPIKPRAKPSDKQLEVQEKFKQVATKRRAEATLKRYSGCRFIKPDDLILDTETTGLGGDAQVIEIAVVSMAGEVLFNSLIRPTVQVEPGAQAVHGISDVELESAMPLRFHYKKLESILAGKTVWAFNASFDREKLYESCIANGLDEFDIEWRCAMYLSADILGATNKYGTISLANACAELGVVNSSAHAALADSQATREVLQSFRSRFDEAQKTLISTSPV